MFSMTGAAGAHFTRLLERDEMPEDAVVMLEQEEDKLTLRIGEAHPRDSTFAHEGRTVLVVRDQLCQELADKTLDVEDTDEGSRLQLR